MTKHLLKCKGCGRYGLTNPEEKCRYCGGQLISPKPPKFSPTDKYGSYRLKYFKEEFDKKLNPN